MKQKLEKKKTIASISSGLIRSLNSIACFENIIIAKKIQWKVISKHFQKSNSFVEILKIKIICKKRLHLGKSCAKERKPTR